MIDIKIQSQSKDTEFYEKLRKTISDLLFDEWDKDKNISYSIDAAFNPNR